MRAKAVACQQCMRSRDETCLLTDERCVVLEQLKHLGTHAGKIVDPVQVQAAVGEIERVGLADEILFVHAEFDDLHALVSIVVDGRTQLIEHERRTVDHRQTLDHIFVQFARSDATAAAKIERRREGSAQQGKRWIVVLESMSFLPFDVEDAIDETLRHTFVNVRVNSIVWIETSSFTLLQFRLPIEDVRFRFRTLATCLTQRESTYETDEQTPVSGQSHLE